MATARGDGSNGAAGTPPRSPARRAPLGLTAAVFFVSGVGALVVETTWMRWFRDLLGATAPAASATLAAFFSGQALGAAAAARVVHRLERPLRAYAGLELAAIGAAAAVPALLLALGAGLDPFYEALREQPAALATARYAAALVASLPAAVCFGATLPVLAAAVIGPAGALGRRGPWLYGSNTLGAATGTAVAAFWLPGVLGVSATYAAGLAALGLAAALALALDRKRPASPSPEPSQAEPARPGPTPPGLSPRSLYCLAALSGLGSFAAQVLLVQAFSRVLNQSTFAFGAVLVVVLLCVAGSALGVGALERRLRPDPGRLLGGALALTAAGLLAFPALFVAATGGLAYLGSGAAWPGSGAAWPGYLGAALALVACTAGLPLLAASGVLPAVWVAAGRRLAGEPDGERASGAAWLGRLVAVNTLGAIAGAVGAPVLLLPGLGLWPAFAALAALYAVGALWPAAGRAPRALLLGATCAAILVWANPWGLPDLRLAPGEELIAAETSAAGFVGVVQRESGRLLQTDNHYALGGSADRVHQERQGHLPLLLHPRPRRVVFFGAATGGSAGAALAHPVEQIWLVELVPAVARLAARYFADSNRGIYGDPRARIVLDDARNFARATRHQFDVAVADLFVPWRAGTGSLYTVEHFEAVRERLAPGGLFCQWLPLYQLSEREFATLLASFLDVFPAADLFRGDFYGRFPIAALVGYTGPRPAPERVSAAALGLAERGEGDRWISHPLGPWALYVGPLDGLAPALHDTPRNREDQPRIEWLAGRRHRGDSGGLGGALVGLPWVQLAERVRAADPAPGRLPAAARRASDGGHALQGANALYASGQEAAAGRALAAAAERLPPELLSAAEADPTASELWHADER